MKKTPCISIRIFTFLFAPSPRDNSFVLVQDCIDLGSIEWRWQRRAGRCVSSLIIHFPVDHSIAQQQQHRCGKAQAIA